MGITRPHGHPICNERGLKHCCWSEAIYHPTSNSKRQSRVEDHDEFQADLELEDEEESLKDEDEN